MSLTKTEVLKQYKDLQRHYGAAHAAMRESDRMFNQEYAGLVDVPYEIRVFQSSTPTMIIDGFRNQIRTHEPTVNVRPFGSSDAAEATALRLQKWGYGALRQERMRAVMDPNAQNAIDLLLRGAACKKIIVDVDNMSGPAPARRSTKAYKEWQKNALRTWPYISTALDPLTVFPVPGQRKPLAFIIEKQIRYAGDLWAQYPDWLDSKRSKRDGADPARPVEWVEYWNEDEYFVLADGEHPFEPRDNPYGTVPYVFSWSGMGRSHEDADPVHLAVGILTPVIGELVQEILLKTAISVQTQMHVFPPILTVEDPKKVAKAFGVGPGKVIKHPPNFPPRYMEYPPPNENHYRFLEAIQQNIARVLSPSLSGGRESGVRFGVLQAQQIGQALTVIAPVRTALNAMGSQTLNLMSQEAFTMDIDMAVEGTEEQVEEPYLIKGSQHEHQNFDVTFESVDPSENDRALLVGQALRRAGDLSQRTYWEVYAKDTVKDPDEEEERLWEERLMMQMFESGALMQFVMQDSAAADFGNVGEVKEAVERTVQNRSRDTMPQEATSRAKQLEALSGTPGSSTIPREVAEEGFREARQSNTGVPRR
jgi:hypothetical protein